MYKSDDVQVTLAEAVVSEEDLSDEVDEDLPPLKDDDGHIYINNRRISAADAARRREYYDAELEETMQGMATDEAPIDTAACNEWKKKQNKFPDLPMHVLAHEITPDVMEITHNILRRHW